jgi:hypothetical protein
MRKKKENSFVYLHFWCLCQRVQIQSIYVEKNAPKSPYVCEKLILKSQYLDNGFQQACKAAIYLFILLLLLFLW